MAKPYEVPWDKIYGYLLLCSAEQDPASFVRTALEEIDDLVPYNQGLVYFLDEHRNVVFQHLVNIKNRWSNLYLDYYSNFGGEELNLSTSVDETAGEIFVKLIVWENEPMNEFLTDYIMARGVRYSLAFVLFDQTGLARVAFSLDRSNKACFTENEITLLKLALAPLSGMFKNFFTSPMAIPGSKKVVQTAAIDTLLTSREQEVVHLLCQGLAPARVASALHISTSTAYKHIANIYKKLHVSSQQELLVRVLNSR